MFKKIRKRFLLNQIQTLTSEARILNPKACGSRGVTPVWGVEWKITLSNFFLFFFSRIDKMFHIFFLKSGQIYMKDAESGKINFPIFPIFSFEIWSFLYSKGHFSMNFENKIDYNSRKKIRNNLKYDFSFESALCASSFMQIWPLLRGVCIALVGKNPEYV